jgi:hypothetical protein
MTGPKRYWRDGRERTDSVFLWKSFAEVQYARKGKILKDIVGIVIYK